MNTFEELLAQYDYAFPPEAVAQKPAEPRDSARLLVYSRATGEVSKDIYRNIVEYLPARSVLVFNATKVVPARLEVMKPTGGRARVLFVGVRGDEAMVMSDRKLEVGSVVKVDESRVERVGAVSFLIAGQEEKYYVLRPQFAIAELDAVLEKYGTTPLPPYITEHGMSEMVLRERYQTVFAANAGSVAAPTASLHFTPELLDAIRAAGHDIHYITLHVGLGTFAPLTEQHVAEGKLHSERYSISQETADAITAARREGRNIIAVGTTVTRTLESETDENGVVHANESATQLFIREGYVFRCVTGLITNFHVPKSSLMMLVGAFVGREKVLGLYRKAIDDGYRLFSFGDGMLLF